MSNLSLDVSGTQISEDRKLVSKSGGDWNDQYLTALKITIVPTTDTSEVIEHCELSREAEDIINLLGSLTFDELLVYPKMIAEGTAPPKYFLPIYKAIYLTQKYICQICCRLPSRASTVSFGFQQG